MTSILLVKTSSLGDVVHNLPVVSDIRCALPDAAIDWLVESTYEAIPRLHGGVRAVIPMGVRRWRKSWWRRETRRELQAAIARLQSQHYDAVVDTQGLLKSALLARAARGARYGLDWGSAREPLGWLYDRTFSVSWTMHAVASLLPAPWATSGPRRWSTASTLVATYTTCILRATTTRC
jgi:heptosyltransferase I